MDFLKSTKGGPFGLAGVRIPEVKRRPPPPPKSAPDSKSFLIDEFEFLIYLKEVQGNRDQIYSKQFKKVISFILILVFIDSLR